MNNFGGLAGMLLVRRASTAAIAGQISRRFFSVTSFRACDHHRPSDPAQSTKPLGSDGLERLKKRRSPVASLKVTGNCLFNFWMSVIVTFNTMSNSLKRETNDSKLGF